MPVVNVIIGRREFQLVCGNGQEDHLRELAKGVNSRINTLTGTMGDANDTVLLVMASLMMQDELNEMEYSASVTNKPANQDLDPNLEIVEAVTAISEYVESIADRIENK